MSIWRTWIGYFLTLTLLAPLVGTFSSLHFQKYQMRRQLKRGLIHSLPQSELLKLQFSRKAAEKELKWEHDREFEFMGVMYDVINRKVESDSITFWCWPDRKETALYQQLDQLLGKVFNNAPQPHKQQQTLLQFLKNLYLQKVDHFNISTLTSAITNHYYCFTYQAPDQVPPLMPPWQTC